MNFKMEYVLMGLVLLLIAWVGNIFFYQSHILKEPLLIKQYCEVNQSRPSFYLYYIGNINQRNEIESISFPEIEPAYVHIERSVFKDNRFYKLLLTPFAMNLLNNISGFMLFPILICLMAELYIAGLFRKSRTKLGDGGGDLNV